MNIEEITTNFKCSTSIVRKVVSSGGGVVRFRRYIDTYRNDLGHLFTGPLLFFIAPENDAKFNFMSNNNRHIRIAMIAVINNLSVGLY